MRVQIPQKLKFLFRPVRYKIARGGRGSAKSWSFARALLIRAGQQPTRTLCAREVQNSIKQSVHQLLEDQIKALGMERQYRVLDTEIRGVNGSLFSFTGLSQHTVDTIKSYESYDICWVEEGQTISKRSWDILIPTIRKEGSEIWVSYNPDLETDETHQRFTVNPPPDCHNEVVNWRDNPWFSETLEQERLHCKKTQPDDYPNIWEGECRPAVEGAIYFKQVQECENQGRICPVPYDPLLKVHIVMDLGWEDSLTAAFVQRHISAIRIIEYLEVNQTTLPQFAEEWKTRRWNWGRVWLPPSDGFSSTLTAEGKSTYDILKRLGWDVATKDEVVRAPSVEEGIRMTRIAFQRMYFDTNLCAAGKPMDPDPTSTVHHTKLSHRLVECLKRYRRHINKTTEAVASPVRDEFAHGADTLRYVALNADKMSNETGSTSGFQPRRPTSRRFAA